MTKQTTKQLMRVFFVIAFLSLIGIFWQWHGKHTSLVKVEGGMFTEGIIGAPRYINPVLAQSPSDKDMTQLIFGTLLYHDASGKRVYDLAESLTQSPDKKKYTLTLKNDIFFHDGSHITSDDLIFTIKKIQDPLTKSPLYNKWEGVQVEKKTNLKVEFTLSQEYSDFEDNLKIGILPQHIWKDIKSEEFIFSKLNERPVGSGPYLVEKIKEKKNGIPEYYLLRKYKKSKGFVKYIKVFFFDNEAELADAYRNHIIDAAYGISANKENKPLFENNYSATGKLPRIFGLFFNQNKNSLLKNKDIRALINHAIQRKDIINKVFSGYAYPIDNPLGGEESDESKYDDITYYNFLKKNNWIKDKDGFYYNEKTKQKMEFTLSTQNIDELIHTANIIKNTLAKYGIKVLVKVFENNDLHENVIRPRDYEMLLFGYMIEKPTDLFAFWHSSQKSDPGFNISLYANPKVDKELEKLRKDKKEANLDIIKNEIKKDIPAVFIYSPAYTYLLPKKIKGEKIAIIEKSDRFLNIKDWYIETRKIWNLFLKKNEKEA